MLARRCHGRHRGRLLLHDRADLLRCGGILLGDDRDTLDLLRERRCLFALRISRRDDEIDGAAARLDLARDLAERYRRRAND